MKLTFAFALNHEGIFENKHFGDADRFAFYEEKDKQISIKEEIKNEFKTNFKDEHGLKAKGEAIVSFLKEQRVKVLISKQFGRNLHMVNQHFVPVIIHQESPQEVLEILNKHKKWFKDELRNRSSNYMLFQIKNGILKSKIKGD